MFQRKCTVVDTDSVTYTSDLFKSLAKCDKEDISEGDQPIHIDEALDTIKCRWCPTWGGSQAVKVINQHVRKSKSHLAARIKELNLVEPISEGAQMHITDFFSNTK